MIENEIIIELRGTIMKIIKNMILIIILSLLFIGCSINNRKIVMPFSASDCKGRNYAEVEDEFRKIGFKDITLKKVADIKIGFLAKEGEVADVTIGIVSKFKKNDEFNSNTKVYITYHVKEIKKNK